MQPVHIRSGKGGNSGAYKQLKVHPRSHLHRAAAVPVLLKGMRTKWGYALVYVHTSAIRILRAEMSVTLISRIIYY